MRQRSETIGALGRAPARTTPAPPPPRGPVKPPPTAHRPDRGAIRRWIHGALFENLGLKFLSMVLAVTVFLLVNTDNDREITVRVPINYVHPADKVLVGQPVDEVRVTIKGAWRILKRFDERMIDRIRLDMNRAPGGEVAINADMIEDLPAGLTVTSISPRSVRVSYDRRVEKLVEVVPTITGRPQHGYVVAETRLSPATVTVRGGESLLAALTEVRTTEIALDRRTEDFEVEARLAPREGVTVDPALRIGVAVRIEEELVTRRIPGLVVGVRGDDAARWTIAPAQVDVTLTGALLAVEKARATLKPHVRLAPSDARREAEVLLEGLPPGVGVRISPERVKLAPVR